MKEFPRYQARYLLPSRLWRLDLSWFYEAGRRFVLPAETSKKRVLDGCTTAGHLLAAKQSQAAVALPSLLGLQPA